MELLYNPTIIISVYDRLDSLNRILTSIENAVYGSYEGEIRLVISIDGGAINNQAITEIAEKFPWDKGEKVIIKHDNNLGLRKHIISCGDLSEKYGDIILLEDDLIVAPGFYIYAKKALDYYRTNNKIAGISLYLYRYNQNILLPFSPQKSTSDVFFLQVPSSWGQAWTKEQWNNFRKYYNKKTEITLNDRLPDHVKRWPETSWKKYFYKYIVEFDLYFVYPFISFSSNCGDIGVHFLERTELLNVPLSYKTDFSSFVFSDFNNDSVIYDAYFERSALYFKKYLDQIPNDELVVDLYGTKQESLFNHEYWLTSRKTKKNISTFSGFTIPIENNIINKKNGNIFCLANRKNIIFQKNINDYLNLIEVYFPVLFLIRNPKKTIFIGWKDNFLVRKIFKLYFLLSKIFYKLFFYISCFILGEILAIIKFRGKRSDRKKCINKEVNRILFIDHIYHLKTKSSSFMIDYLKKFYEVDVLFVEKWSDETLADLSFFNKSYFAVVFWQSFPGHETIKYINNDNIIFFPMYDDISHYYVFWKKMRRVKVVSFSSVLYKKISRWGIESIYLKYFPKPGKFTPGNNKEIFFWQRTEDITLNMIDKLIVGNDYKLHCHKVLDPNKNFIKPDERIESKFNITYSNWFDHKEDMQKVLDEKGIYISPRKKEGIGMSFLEAMASGKAVIASNMPTMNEYIKNGVNGYLFNCKRLKLIDLSNIKQVQENSYKFMKEGYDDWEKNKHQIIDFIEK